MDPTYSVTDLSHQMSNYSIQQSSRSRQQSSLGSSASSECSSPVATDSTFSLATSSSAMTPVTSPESSAPPSRSSTYQTTNVRAQRQRALRRQCSSGHLAEIADLVSRMVNNGEQCSVCSRSSPPPPSHAASSSSASATSTPHQPIRLARQGSDTSDGSISPFSRVTFDEDENMVDEHESSNVSDAEDFFGSSTSAFGNWDFSWDAGRSKVGESAAERKGCITKDTRSRKHSARRR